MNRIITIIFTCMCLGIYSQTYTTLANKGLMIQIGSSTDSLSISKDLVKVKLIGDSVIVYDASGSYENKTNRETQNYVLVYSNFTTPTFASSQILLDTLNSWFVSSSSGTITGSGLTNDITKWTSSTAIGRSVMIDTNSSISLGHRLPTGSLDIKGAGSTSSTYGLKVQNSSGNFSLLVDDNGSVYNYGLGAVVTNTAFGLGALSSNTTGGTNTAFGVDALSTTTIGGLNSAFGSNALKLTTGSENSAFGNGCLSALTTGSKNSGFGSGTLSSLSTGDGNSSFGYQSGQAYTGNYSVSVGHKSISKGSGNSNVAVGYETLFNLGTGANNTSIGTYSGYALTTGSGNIFLGNYAGRYITTESDYFLVNNTATGKSNVTDELNKSLIVGTMNSTVTSQNLKINAPIQLYNMTYTEAGTVSASNGMIIYVSSTDATFTSVGFWGYEAGSWVKL